MVPGLTNSVRKSGQFRILEKNHTLVSVLAMDQKAEMPTTLCQEMQTGDARQPFPTACLGAAGT